jgi:ABC-type transport system involved in multi-copper enzyme maturation permease subunit
MSIGVPGGNRILLRQQERDLPRMLHGVRRGERTRAEAARTVAPAVATAYTGQSRTSSRGRELRMSPLILSTLAWLRRNFTWSNSRQSWEERLAVLAVGAGGLAVYWLRDVLPVGIELFLWAALAAAFLYAWRRGWLKFFGPVFLYELLRVSRRSRYFFLRTAYAGGLLLLLCYTYLVTSLDGRAYQAPTPNALASLAATFFYVFMFAQFTLVTLLTPAYVAGAIAEEKERRTLEFILATDLRNREIVLGKLAARVANLTLLVLAGLPVLSLLQFLGGVDPGLVVAGFAATGLSLVSLAGLSIFHSVLCKRAFDAIVLSYLTVAAYAGLSLVCWGVLLAAPAAAGWPTTQGWTSPVTLGDVSTWFGAGNPLIVVIELAQVVSSGGRLDHALFPALARYAAFHGLVTAACVTWSVVRLRALALKQTFGTTAKPGLKTRLLGRPRIGAWPMLWKEVFVEGGLRLNWLGRVIALALVAASFVPVGFIVYEFYERLTGVRGGRYGGVSGAFDRLGRDMNDWVLSVGTIVACLGLLGVAVRAAGSISRERDRHTFDDLLTTPLDSSNILFAKWVGAVASARWVWVWLGVIWALALVTGGLSPFAVPFLGAAWVAYAAVAAVIGLWCSMTCRTTLRATVWTIFLALGVSVGHWLVMALFCYLPLDLVGEHPEGVRQLMRFQAGQTPPFALSWLAYENNGLLGLSVRRYRGGHDLDLTIYSLCGIACWAGLAVVLWQFASQRLRALTGRSAVLLPERGYSPRLAQPRARPESHPRPRAVVATEEIVDLADERFSRVTPDPAEEVIDLANQQLGRVTPVPPAEEQRRESG